MEQCQRHRGLSAAPNHHAVEELAAVSSPEPHSAQNGHIIEGSGSRSGSSIAQGEVRLPLHSSPAEGHESSATSKSGQTDAESRQRQRQLWMAAIKPPMYSVAIIPILVSLLTFLGLRCMCRLTRQIARVGGSFT